MSGDEVRVPTWKPPKWVNTFVKAMLHTPGVQRLVGSNVALITVTGRRSGRRITTPVSYNRQAGAVIVLTKRVRTWWLNLFEQPEVELRLAGHTFRGRARPSVADERELPTLVAFLEHRPRDAKAYGVTLDADGHMDERRARALLSQLVVIRISIDQSSDG